MSSTQSSEKRTEREQYPEQAEEHREACCAGNEGTLCARRGQRCAQPRAYTIAYSPYAPRPTDPVPRGLLTLCPGAQGQGY